MPYDIVKNHCYYTNNTKKKQNKSLLLVSFYIREFDLNAVGTLNSVGSEAVNKASVKTTS